MSSLLRSGHPLNALDMLIAGTAAANGSEMILSNDDDFQKDSKDFRKSKLSGKGE